LQVPKKVAFTHVHEFSFKWRVLSVVSDESKVKWTLKKCRRIVQNVPRLLFVTDYRLLVFCLASSVVADIEGGTQAEGV
jgi:hypothetical protein